MQVPLLCHHQMLKQKFQRFITSSLPRTCMSVIQKTLSPPPHPIQNCMGVIIEFRYVVHSPGGEFAIKESYELQL